MDRYDIALGKKPPPPLINPEAFKIYYMGVTIHDSKHWTVAICREKTNATIDIVETFAMNKYSDVDEIVHELNALNKKYPIKLGLIDSSLLLKSFKSLNFQLPCKRIKDDLKNEINEFYEFWMNIPGVSKLGSGEGYKIHMVDALKLSFWALHEALTKEIPDLYTNRDSFNKHAKELQRLHGEPDVVYDPPTRDTQVISTLGAGGPIIGMTGIEGMPTVSRSLSFSMQDSSWTFQ